MKVTLSHIHKRFGAVHANNDISINVEGGTIFGLLGENGAGKSTLMKVLSGFFAADSGEIKLNDQVVSLSSPADALEKGIGMLHQDPLDVPPMRLLENFMMGVRGFLQPRRTAESSFRELCQAFDFDLDPHAFVHDLSVGERQQLEIVRLLWLGVETLILDEPTTGISAPQKEKLFATLHQLAADGKSIIFVSHKLEDVEVLCSEVAVLRQGVLVGQQNAPIDPAGLVKMMFVQEVNLEERLNVDLGSTFLQVQDATMSDLRLKMEGVTLDVKAGEVIGLAGLEGSGQQLLMQACAGLHRIDKGAIVVGGQTLSGRPYQEWLNAGVAFMPADRMAEGLVPGLSIAEHHVLTRYRRDQEQDKKTIDWPLFRKHSQEKITEFNIKGFVDSTVESLSGGNQQRALLSLLPKKLRLLIMEHPTRGLDIESVLYIWGKLLKRRQDGTAIIFSSADLDEVFQYSDRIVVCFGGQITAVLNTSETSVEQLGYLIAGKQPPADLREENV
ncbi:MAG: ATP-binding cassette domain-containing protein [Ardenticatenaceae bacterium]|nr:ATP-binding cassette domain-containing protein [Ardenticatenaceae bacterium]